jgi:predicted kinase
VKKLVTIVRGIPGSGKSFYAEEFCKRKNLNVSFHVCSADDYFRVNGAYVFDPMKLPQAHASCMAKFIYRLMVDKCSPVFVDNTHIKKWEYNNYRELALHCGYEVEIVEFRAETITDVAICAARNTHRVPQEIVWRMAMEFEPDPDAVVFQIVR